MATYTNFNDELFSAKALEGFVATLAPFMAFSTNFSPSAGARGDTVLVPLIASITATTFNGSYAVCGGSLSSVTVTINKHKVAAVGQDDLTAANSSIANLERFAFQQGSGLATLVMQDILSLCTTANFGSATAVASTALAIADIRKARLALNQANAPYRDRVLMLDCVPFDSLLAITNFVQAYMTRIDDKVLQEGYIGRALGFNLAEINSLFPSGNSVMGLAAHPSSIAIAMRYLQPQRPDRYDRAEPIGDPTTGAVIGLRDHYDTNTGSRYVNLECNYGYSVGISNGARLIKQTD
jgi:hypothetical protein